VINIKVKKIFRNLVKDCRSYPGADIDVKHNLLMMESNIRFKKMVLRKNKDQWHTNKIKGRKDQ